MRIIENNLLSQTIAMKSSRKRRGKLDFYKYAADDDSSRLHIGLRKSENCSLIMLTLIRRLLDVQSLNLWIREELFNALLIGLVLV